MSNMLEQAIVDAQALREAALKSAESSIVEKYSDEVKNAIEKLLEQDVEEDEVEVDPLALDMEPPEPEESSVVADIPMSHDPEAPEDEVVVIDLDQIIAAAEAEEGTEDEDFELSSAEIADEIGLPSPGEPSLDSVANRSDDVEIDESDLLDMFKEMLVVDVDQQDIEKAERESEAAEKEEEFMVDVSSVRDDGMDKKDIEAHDRLTTRLEMDLDAVRQENKNYKDIIVKIKDRLEEVNLSNARLLYANRVLQDPSLNEQQKNKIAGMISSARTVEEAKMIHETLQKTLASTPKRRAPNSLSEAVSRKSSVILSGNRKEKDTVNDPVKNRWATLAGIGYKKN